MIVIMNGFVCFDIFHNTPYKTNTGNMFHSYRTPGSKHYNRGKSCDSGTTGKLFDKFFKSKETFYLQEHIRKIYLTLAGWRDPG